MTVPTFGIYIKTHRPDYYLARPLIASLCHYAPGVDITIIPDDGYDQPTLWGLPALNLKDPFLAGLQGYFKKLWVFFGPYERFIYLDADMLALKPLAPLIERIRKASQPFFLVCAESKMLERLSNADETMRLAVYRNHIGDPCLLRELDATYNWERHFPFNSGFFATHKGFVSRDKLESVFCSAQELNARRGLPPLAYSREGVFMTDQGLINYLAHTSGVTPCLVQDCFYWGGKLLPEVAPDGCSADDAGYFVHWAGCPRPSFLHRRVPCGREWIRFRRDYYRAYGSICSYLVDTGGLILSDIRSHARSTLRRLLPF